MDLNERLAVLRRKQGLTQDELALKVGVSRQTVSKWERGVIAPSMVNLAALGLLYGIPLDELANGELSPQGEPAAVAVAEGPEAPPLESRRLKIAAGAVLAACLLLVTAAAVITIWSAIFKEPEEPGDEIIWIDDLDGEYIDPAEIIDDAEGRIIIP